MKKVYIAPQTEAIQLLSENAIMMVSPGGATDFNGMYGNGTGGGSRQEHRAVPSRHDALAR